MTIIIVDEIALRLASQTLFSNIESTTDKLIIIKVTQWGKVERKNPQEI